MILKVCIAFDFSGASGVVQLRVDLFDVRSKTLFIKHCNKSNAGNSQTSRLKSNADRYEGDCIE